MSLDQMILHEIEEGYRAALDEFWHTMLGDPEHPAEVLGLAALVEELR